MMHYLIIILINPLLIRIVSSSTTINSIGTIKSGLEEYFNKRITWSPDVLKERHKWLYQQALELEQKASKVDAVLHTVDQFNNNAIKVTVKWDMRNNILNPKASTVIPGLYTIVKKYPNILFSLNPSTKYSEYLHNCCVCMIFHYFPLIL